MKSQQNQQDGTMVELHTNIGKPGVILELRPQEYDIPSERDMSHLTDDKAQELYDQLGEYLSEK